MISSRRGNPVRRVAFSVAEVVVVVALGAVVLGIVLALLVHAVGSIQRSDDRTDPAEMVHLALMTVRQTLSDAQAYVVSDSGTLLRYVTGRGEGEIAWDRTRKSVLFKAPGRTASAPVASGVTRFQVQPVRPGLLHVWIEVERPGRGRARAQAGPLWMTDDIVVACAVPTDPWLPWRCPQALLAAASPAGGQAVQR